MGASRSALEPTATGCFADFVEGTAGHGFPFNIGSPFSTYDNDLAQQTGDCTDRVDSGWWRSNGCEHSNLNGRYLGREPASGTDYPPSAGVWWNPWRGEGASWLGKGVSLKMTRMTLRPSSQSG